MKPILIFYLNIGNISSSVVDEYISKAREQIMANADANEYVGFIIPIRRGENRVECVNPVISSKEEYEKVLRILENIEHVRRNPVIVLLDYKSDRPAVRREN